jgi:hypothetical protein
LKFFQKAHGPRNKEAPAKTKKTWSKGAAARHGAGGRLAFPCEALRLKTKGSEGANKRTKKREKESSQSPPKARPMPEERYFGPTKCGFSIIARLSKKLSDVFVFAVFRLSKKIQDHAAQRLRAGRQRSLWLFANARARS